MYFKLKLFLNRAQDQDKMSFIRGFNELQMQNNAFSLLQAQQIIKYGSKMMLNALY